MASFGARTALRRVQTLFRPDPIRAKVCLLNVALQENIPATLDVVPEIFTYSHESRPGRGILFSKVMGNRKDEPCSTDLPICLLRLSWPERICRGNSDMAETLLDQAWIASEAEPDNDALRLRFYARLVEGEVFLLLDKEPQGDHIEPKLFDLEEGPIVLAFDLEARLTEFTGLPAPYAAMPGRMLVEMLAGQKTGLGLNLGVAPSSRLLPPEILDWLAQTLSERPQELSARITGMHPPKGLPETLLLALDQRLARMEGLARMAYLVGTSHEGGARGHLLAFVDAAPGAEAALARAVQGALSFSGVEAALLDVTFLSADESRAAECARVGLRFDLPQPDASRPQPNGPGLDPARPPRLR